MTLIIGARCTNGCLVLADRRCFRTFDGVETYRDNFHKVVVHDDCLVYNNGYNQIMGKDWKRRVRDLTPDPANPVYKEILKEMKSKSYKEAWYVFMNMTTFCEIAIGVGQGIKAINHMPNRWIRSGSGKDYVDTGALVDLEQLNCGEVRPRLINTFKWAHYKMKATGGRQFSKEYDILRL